MEATGRGSRSMEVNAARLARSVAELESDHPRRRFVLGMRMFACGRQCTARDYSDDAAEQSARTLLVPTAA